MSALNNTFEEIDEAISGVTSSISFGSNEINIEDILYLDTLSNKLGINDETPSEALGISGNMMVDGYINQVVSDGAVPSISYFPNNGDGGFYKDTNFEKLYLCYNDTGNFIFQEFNNESFDKLTNTFSEIDDALIGIDSLTPTFSEIDSILVGINSWVNPLSTVDQEISSLTGLSSTYQEIDYAANGVASLSVDFDDIDSGIGFTLNLNYSASQVNSSLSLANTALQNGDNVSSLINDSVYIASGDNVSNLVNDSNYISTYSYNAVSVDYTGDSNDSVIDATVEDLTISLPTAVGIVGEFYIVKNSSTGVATLESLNPELIDGQSSLSIASQDSVTVLSTDSNWITI